MSVLKKLVTVGLVGMIVPSFAIAHAYVSSPPSRGYQCSLEKAASYANADAKCGAVINEPQSLEAPSGFPSAGPADGKLASANGLYPKLDQQTASLWRKTPIEAGKNTFTWTFAAEHATANWNYYITKQGWNPNAPLTRASFELTPFCTYSTRSPIHSCNVPQRTGYQVIYAVWKVGDTTNSFYNVIDVQFSDSTTPSLWSELLTGTLTGKDLKVGDTVYARFYNDNGAEISGRMTELKITDPSRATSAQWSLDLANKINSTSSDIRAGIKDASGNVTPIAGANNVYTKIGTYLGRVGITYSEQSIAVNSATVGNIVGEKIQNQKSKISFDVDTKGTVIFEAKVTDANKVQKGSFGPVSITNIKQNLDIALTNVAPGAHMLVYTVKNTNGSVIENATTKSFTLESGTTPSPATYEFKFPESLTSYKAGTLVLQPKNGNVYRCKVYPYSGYCKQWSPTATSYEPGVGAAWTSAWEKVN